MKVAVDRWLTALFCILSADDGFRVACKRVGVGRYGIKLLTLQLVIRFHIIINAIIFD